MVARFADLDYEAAAVMEFAGMLPIGVTGSHDGEPVIEYRIAAANGATFEVRLHDDGSFTEGWAHPTGDMGVWQNALAGWDDRRDAFLNDRNSDGLPSDVYLRDGLARLAERGMPVRDFARYFPLGDYSVGDVVQATTNLGWSVGEDQRDNPSAWEAGS